MKNESPFMAWWNLRVFNSRSSKTGNHQWEEEAERLHELRKNPSVSVWVKCRHRFYQIKVTRSGKLKLPVHPASVAKERCRCKAIARAWKEEDYRKLLRFPELIERLGLEARYAEACRMAGIKITPPRSQEPAASASAAIEAKVVGASDADRQGVVASLQVGDPAWLLRDPTNPSDANAVLVVDDAGHGLGHLHRLLAEEVSPHLDAYGVGIPATISSVVSAVPMEPLSVYISFVLPELTSLDEPAPSGPGVKG